MRMAYDLEVAQKWFHHYQQENVMPRRSLPAVLGWFRETRMMKTMGNSRQGKAAAPRPPVNRLNQCVSII
jgi:hypothetical protein